MAVGSAALLSENATVKVDSFGGLGIFAANDMPVGTVVASIPLEEVIVEMVGREEAFAQEERAAIGRLAEALLLQGRVNETSVPSCRGFSFGSSSSYVRIPHTPLMLLAQMPTRERTALASVLTVFMHASEDLDFFESLHYDSHADVVTREEWICAIVAVKSRVHRAWYLDRQGDYTPGLGIIRYADMFNAPSIGEHPNVACATGLDIVVCKLIS